MPSPAPGFAPVDLLLHIGSDKTGTSSIQVFMHRHRDLLAERGWLYPTSPGSIRHARMSLFIRPDHGLLESPAWSQQGFDSPDEFRSTFRRELLAELGQWAGGRVVISDEALYGARRQPLTRLRALTDEISRRLRAVVYLRRQDDRLISRYQQEVKVGETERLTDRIDRGDLPKHYDYASRLRLWTSVMEPEHLEVRRYEPSSFVEGSLEQDFLAAAGIDLSGAHLRNVNRRNESLGVEGVELLRLANRLRRDGSAGSLPPNKQILRRLRGTDTGPVLTLPGATLDAFMARWAESNREVATRYLGDPDGELFRSPRKMRNVTTEQRIDPARLDHYAELLELDRASRDALRSLAGSG